MMVKKATTLREDDKTSLKAFVQEHQTVFGKGTLASLGTDKNYFSLDNVKSLQQTIAEVLLQQPIHIKKEWSGLEEETQEKLRNRRAGIEPLIGHVKRFGLGKSRMKSDDSTEASAYRAVLGFNLHQLIRHQQGLFKACRGGG